LCWSAHPNPAKVRGVLCLLPATRAAGAGACLVLLAACAGGPAPAASTSPTPTAVPSPSPRAAGSPRPRPTAIPSGSPSNSTCTGAIDSTHNLVLATLEGSTTVILRDITNTSAAQTICTFTGTIGPHFATASVVGYADGSQSTGSPGNIKRVDLAAGVATTVASWGRSGFGSGSFDWSPDGTRLTYIGAGAPGPTWHLVSGGTDRLLTTLPAVPGRGTSPQSDDDFMLAFSPDGLYLALVQTFSTGGSGETAPLQIRRAGDGALVYSAGSGTMAVWASVPSRLFFRSADGVVSRWDPSSGVTTMQSSLRWHQPHASPDGRWIAYTIYDSSQLPHVGLYSVQSNSLGPQPAGLRSGALFLNNGLLWYQEEAASECGLGGCSQTTGRTFIYDIAGAAESKSRLTGVFDAWPRVTAPPGL
jgi:hypothetical protein